MKKAEGKSKLKAVNEEDFWVEHFKNLLGNLKLLINLPKKKTTKKLVDIKLGQFTD